MLDGAEWRAAAQAVSLGVGTARKIIDVYNGGGWQALLRVQAPRGGDFLARYDQGFWAERLTRVCLDQSQRYRAIPYGTSRSEPFTDLHSFRQYTINEFLLQAWSESGRWKRPDLLLLPRDMLREEQGNDAWTPDLQHFDNAACEPYIRQATVAIEVEMSLWQVRTATVQLSFTVKDEDLESLRNWVKGNRIPLYILQVFYDQAYVLPFSTLEELIGLPPTDDRHVPATVDRFTKKPTYMVPLTQGALLGTIAEPDVEGRVFKAPNGRVTVYGRLTGSAIAVLDMAILEQLAAGSLKK
jgi:hypothetical protein